MAHNTDLRLRNQVIYSVFVRNYSPEGTFRALEKDLGRIRALGADIVWLMPIHPIGVKNRKGTLGSPYAIRDYRKVNPEYGTMEDFRSLTEAIHALGMKCMIDVVYNHTSPDSWLMEHHPEWFYRRADGSAGNRVGDWSDIVDLDYGNRDLWEYQIETLRQWAELVDGFRCDVAPMVPLAFWLEAREQVAKVRPDCLWLAESVEPGFVRELRRQGFGALSDGEVYRAFDMAYDYDVYGSYLSAVTGTGSLSAYLAALDAQEGMYPANYVKMRMLENHDRLRAAALIPDPKALRNWTAFSFFLKGIPLIYNGQERGCTERPGLFDKDTIRWEGGQDLTGLIRTLSAIRRDPVFTDSAFTVREHNGIAVAEHESPAGRLIGLFCLASRGGAVPCAVPDGDYRDLLSGNVFRADQGLIPVFGEPAILRVTKRG